MRERLTSLYRLAVVFFREQYYGSVAGPVWLVLEPIVFASIVWFFFFYALKATAPGGIPFSGWLMTGMSIWILSATCIGAAPGFYKKNFHVANMAGLSIRHSLIAFQLASLPVHCVFLVLLVLIDFIASDGVSHHYLVLPLFLLLQMVFFHAFGLCLAVVGAYFKDIQNALGIIMQILMWSSPIFWDPSSLPRLMGQVMMFNPLYLPISGYRYAVFGLPFPPVEAWAAFAIMCAVFWLVSLRLYNRSKATIGDFL